LQSPCENSYPEGHWHRPLEHVPSWLTPHFCPFIPGFAPPLTHCWTPVAHDSTPFEQGSTFTPVQLAPAAQLQLPLPSQALEAPLEQVVPAGWFPDAAQTGAPLEQSSAPVLQAFAV
jgi:hypothetical protein